MAKQYAIPENEIVRRLLDQAGTAGIVEMAGFIGPAMDKKQVRIYRDLTLSMCVDVARDDVLHHVASSDSNPASPSTVFIRNTADVSAMSKVRVSQSAEITIRADVNAAEVERARGRNRVSMASDCACGSASAAQAQRAGNNGGPELPPMDCEIRCELQENICGDHWWCWLDRWLCDYYCDNPRPGGGVGVVIA